MSPSEGVGGHNVYCTDLCMDFNQTCTDTFWDSLKELLNFHDLDLIFKVTRFMLLYEYPCQRSILRTYDYILTKLAQIHHWEDIKKCLDFSDLDLIFKAIRSYNSIKELLDFSDHDLIFKDTRVK